jgi:hypothetical protein
MWRSKHGRVRAKRSVAALRGRLPVLTAPDVPARKPGLQRERRRIRRCRPRLQSSPPRHRDRRRLSDRQGSVMADRIVRSRRPMRRCGAQLHHARLTQPGPAVDKLMAHLASSRSVDDPEQQRPRPTLPSHGDGGGTWSQTTGGRFGHLGGGLELSPRFKPTAFTCFPYRRFRPVAYSPNGHFCDWFFQSSASHQHELGRVVRPQVTVVE